MNFWASPMFSSLRLLFVTKFRHEIDPLEVWNSRKTSLNEFIHAIPWSKSPVYVYVTPRSRKIPHAVETHVHENIKSKCEGKLHSCKPSVLDRRQEKSNKRHIACNAQSYQLTPLVSHGKLWGFSGKPAIRKRPFWRSQVSSVLVPPNSTHRS